MLNCFDRAYSASSCFTKSPLGLVFCKYINLGTVAATKHPPELDPLHESVAKLPLADCCCGLCTKKAIAFTPKDRLNLLSKIVSNRIYQGLLLVMRKILSFSGGQLPRPSQLLVVT